MLTIDTLKAFGANTDEGVARCFGKEAFYLRLVGTVPAEANFDRLADAIGEGNLDAAFESAHALKGVLSNLSLTPILEPVSEITEALRSKKEMDYSAPLQIILSKRDELKKICES